MNDPHAPRPRTPKERLLPTCRDVSELATDYMEGALTLRDSLGVRFHLSRCIACRTYMKQLRSTVALLRGRTMGDAPPGVAEQISREATQRIDQGKPESRD